MEGSFQVVIDALKTPRATQGMCVTIWSSRRTADSRIYSWTSELILPLYSTIASGFILVLHLLSTTAPFRELFKRNNHEQHYPPPARTSHVGLVAEVKAHVQKHGGRRIFGFHLARLLFTLGLLVLAVATLVIDVEEDGKPGNIVEMLKKKRKHRKKHREDVSGGMNDREWLEFGMTLTFVSVLSVTHR